MDILCKMDDYLFSAPAIGVAIALLHTNGGYGGGTFAKSGKSNQKRPSGKAFSLPTPIRVALAVGCVILLCPHQNECKWSTIRKPMRFSDTFPLVDTGMVQTKLSPRCCSKRPTAPLRENEKICRLKYPRHRVLVGTQPKPTPQ